MNIFIKLDEKRKSITIKNNNISILELIEQIKNEITQKDEIKIEIKNFEIKLFFKEIELSKEKNLNDYNIKNNDEIIVEIIENDIYSYSFVEEKQFLCNFCFSILKNAIQLKCNHFYCENCFEYLKLIQNIDKNTKQNQLKNNKIEEKSFNSIKCLICNTINGKNENLSNLNDLKLKIENYLNEKNKIEIINCEGGTEEESCSNIASIRCEKCEINLCEDCFKKFHLKKIFKNHKIVNIIKGIERFYFYFLKIYLF
jgi:hypothetical protein